MQLIADIVTEEDELTQSIYTYAAIVGSISHSQWIKNQKDVFFIIDSGATTTTLSPFFAKSININVKKLTKSIHTCQMANGKEIRPRILCYPEIKFNIIGGNTEPKEEIFNPQRILVIPFSKRKKIEPSPNLLGMDILGIFTHWNWNYNKGKLYLTP